MKVNNVRVRRTIDRADRRAVRALVRTALVITTVGGSVLGALTWTSSELPWLWLVLTGLSLTSFAHQAGDAVQACRYARAATWCLTCRRAAIERDAADQVGRACRTRHHTDEIA